MNKKAFEKLFMESRRYSSFVIIKTLNAIFYADSYSFDKKYPKLVVFYWRDSIIGYCYIRSIIEVI